MRSFRGSTGDASRGKYMAGVLSGVAATILLLGITRAAIWALGNPVVAEVQAWASTPQYTPLDVAAWFFTGMIVVLMVVVLVEMNRL